VKRHRDLAPARAGAAMSALAALLLCAGGASTDAATVRVGFCARTISAAAAPFAIATKMGWFGEGGIDVALIGLPGSTDCVKNVATHELPFALPSIEPVAIIHPQGVKERNFYTAYQGNTYGLAVAADSPIKSIADLKGARIGVTSMASAGVIIARALIADHGMNPDRDVSIVVAGEAAQTAALVRGKQVDALSQFDTQYALIENAGVKMRMLDNEAISRFPANGFIALEETLQKQRGEAVALGQGYAKGTIFAVANPEAAVRILYEVFPQTKPTGKDEATAIRDDVKVLEARAPKWTLAAGGVTKWGENSLANYAAYIDFLLKWGVLKQKVDAADLITNDLIDDINKFDPADVARQAKSTK
jgi:NitT/TauT family transport system substrate-binding protein